MKVLFLSGIPCALAHGGAQVVADKLIEHLPDVGIEAEPLRWWDGDQRGDILHHIGRPSSLLVALAHAKGMRCVMTQFLDQTSNRGRAGLALRRGVARASRAAGRLLRRPHSTEVYRELDAMVYVNAHEWNVARRLYDAPAGRGHLIGHGLDDAALVALRADSQPVGAPYLASVATIVARKNTLRLAECARAARVPVHFVGKPLAESDPYFCKFLDLVDDEFVIYRGFVDEDEKRSILRDARGFALISEYESGCIAVYEAAAAGLPLLLSDLPWATHHYPASPRIHYARPTADDFAERLRAFYDGAVRTPDATFTVPSWREVAAQYRAVYASLR